jgi:hypothetical protein
LAVTTNNQRSTPAPSDPPRSYFSVWHRLFRGYGPLAVFAALLILMALLIPSKVPSSGNATNGVAAPGTGIGTGNGVSPGGGTGTGSGTGSGTNASASSGLSGGGGTSASGGSGATGSGSSSGGASGSATGIGGGTQSSSGGAAPAAAAAGVGTCAGRQVSGDPYAPPCTTWSGNNGGATSKGVTAGSILVTYRVTDDQSFQQTLAQLAGASLADSQADVERTITALAQYFNTHYQFYGRKIQVQFFNGQGSLTNELLGQGQAQAEADAVTVGQQIKAFADISAESEPYSDALTHEGVMAFGDPYMSQEWHEQHAPYAWSIAADGTKVTMFAAEYVGKKLCPAGSPAVYAGGDLKGKPRKFAFLAPDNSWYQESVDVGRSILQNQYHCDPGDNIEYTLDLGTMSNQAANIIAKLQSEGVTTLICGCDPIIPVFLSGVAARQNYFPEFIITGTALTDQDIVGQLWNQQFADHAFGISPNEAPVPSTQTLGYAAYKTVRSDEPAFVVDLIYDQMAQMAIGIQMAGPDLTPQNFERGMQAYPPSVGPAGLWNFAPGNFTIGEDVREICWSPTAVSTYNQKVGAYIQTSNQRWQAGQIPTGPPGCPIPSS